MFGAARATRASYVEKIKNGRVLVRRFEGCVANSTLLDSEGRQPRVGTGDPATECFQLVNGYISVTGTSLRRHIFPMSCCVLLSFFFFLLSFIFRFTFQRACARDLLLIQYCLYCLFHFLI